MSRCAGEHKGAEGVAAEGGGLGRCAQLPGLHPGRQLWPLPCQGSLHPVSWQLAALSAACRKLACHDSFCGQPRHWQGSFAVLLLQRLSLLLFKQMPGLWLNQPRSAGWAAAAAGVPSAHHRAPRPDAGGCRIQQYCAGQGAESAAGLFIHAVMKHARVCRVCYFFCVADVACKS